MSKYRIDFLLLSISLILNSCGEVHRECGYTSSGYILNFASPEIMMSVNLPQCVRLERTSNGEANIYAYEASIANGDTVMNINLSWNVKDERFVRTDMNTFQLLSYRIERMQGVECGVDTANYFILQRDSLTFHVLSSCGMTSAYCALNQEIDLSIDFYHDENIDYMKTLINGISLVPTYASSNNLKNGVSVRHVSNEVSVEFEIPDCIKFERSWYQPGRYYAYEAFIIKADSTQRISFVITTGSERQYGSVADTLNLLRMHNEKRLDTACDISKEKYLKVQTAELNFHILNSCGVRCAFCSLNAQTDLWINYNSESGDNMDDIMEIVKGVRLE